MAFAPSKRRRKRSVLPKRSLTAMLDMMTILLLFLLKSYSTSGALIKPSIENLPESSSSIYPEKTLAIIASLEDGIREDVEVDTRTLASVEELNDSTTVLLSGLARLIEGKRAEYRLLGKEEQLTRLTIQGAADIPYSWILKITATGQSAGIQQYDFLIIREKTTRNGEG